MPVLRTDAKIMAERVEFLHQLLHTGKVVLHGPPVAVPEEHPAALELLERAYRRHQLDVSGPPLEFRPDLALAVGEFVRHACWYLVRHDEPAAVLEKRLTLPTPASPADHLTGDLLLRYVPQLHRRARALAPNDPLGAILARVLRQWPLSGVLADVVEAPLTSIAFAGHPGLLLLYAERLFHNQKAEWLPTDPGAFAYVELVFRDHGQERSPFLRKGPATEELAKATP
jgi:hypothetical protein